MFMKPWLRVGEPPNIPTFTQTFLPRKFLSLLQGGPMMCIASTLTWIEYISDCSVQCFWRKRRKNIRKLWYLWSYQKGHCIFCIKLPFLPLNTSKFSETFKPYSFFYSISKDPKRNEPHGNSIAELQGIFEACRLVLFHKEMSQPGATITNHWTKR